MKTPRSLMFVACLAGLFFNATAHAQMRAMDSATPTPTPHRTRTTVRGTYPGEAKPANSESPKPTPRRRPAQSPTPSKHNRHIEASHHEMAPSPQSNGETNPQAASPRPRSSSEQQSAPHYASTIIPEQLQAIHLQWDEQHKQLWQTSTDPALGAMQPNEVQLDNGTGGNPKNPGSDSIQSCTTNNTAWWGLEYPSTGNTTVPQPTPPNIGFWAQGQFFMLASELNNQNTIHIYFPQEPCISCSTPHQYKITKGSYSATTPESGAWFHLQIPKSVLTMGANVFTLQLNCGGVWSPFPYVSSTLIVNVVSSFSAAVTLTPECCLNGSSYTGQIRFKMTGSATVPAPLAISSASGNQTENFVSGGYTQCYSSPIQVSLGNSSISGSINGQSVYTYVKPWRACVTMIPIKADLSGTKNPH